MKRLVSCALVIVLLISFNISFADSTLSNEDKYGMELEFEINNDYPGEVKIDGLYVYQENDVYVFSILYSNGELKEMNDNGSMKVKTSFFNPPSGSIIMTSWIDNYDNVISDENKVQYIIEKNLLDSISNDHSEENMITVFLYDINFDNNEENISVYFRIDQLDSSEVTHVSSLKSGHEINNEKLDAQISTGPSEWALKSIEELRFENLLREEAFENFQDGITRERFVYLMVNLYEQLTSESVEVDNAIHFEDSKDLYVMKAASLGITSGIGDSLFGPEIIIDREQMATFVIKTLKLAGVDLEYDGGYVEFEDDTDIGEWAKASTYLAKKMGIISGIGDNRFAAKVQATNEQALCLTHKLLYQYGNLKWFNEFDRDRFYVKYKGELYKVKLEDNILISNEEDIDILFKSYNDINTFLNLIFLENKKLSYIKSTNPNFKGVLEEFDYEKMRIEVTNLYRGVDKVGEETEITINDGDYYARVIDQKIGASFYDGFYLAKYYDIEKNRQKVNTLSIKEICDSIGIEYSIEYDSKWKVVFLEVQE